MPPEHPRGYVQADDSPAFVAPPLDLRRAIDAVHEGSVEDAVNWALIFPTEGLEHVHVEGRAHEHTLGFEDESRGARTLDGEGAPSAEQDAAPESEVTLQRNPYRNDGETTVEASERVTLTHNLRSIGPVDESPDPLGEIPVPMRVLLGRARATRFRLALLDVWPEDWEPAHGVDEHLELAVHPTALVTIADGFPSDPPDFVGSDDIAVVAAVARLVIERMPHVSRSTLRDAGAAAFARVTLLGGERGLEYLNQRFARLPEAERRLALATAAKIATPGPRAETLERAARALGL